MSEEVADIEDFGFSGLERLQGQLRDLFELRGIVEPQAARLACRRATETELEEILARGAEVEDCIRAGRDRTAADREVHTAIVRATHNEYMLRLLPLIRALFCEVNPIPVKAGVNLLGYEAGLPRAPLTEIEPENLQKLCFALEKITKEGKA